MELKTDIRIVFLLLQLNYKKCIKTYRQYNKLDKLINDMNMESDKPILNIDNLNYKIILIIGDTKKEKKNNFLKNAEIKLYLQIFIELI